MLDTGIDDRHPRILAHEMNNRIKVKRSWIAGDTKNTAPDTQGHGTAVASLLLDNTPNAVIYVAKVVLEDRSLDPKAVADVRVCVCVRLFDCPHVGRRALAVSYIVIDLFTLEYSC